MNTSGLRHIALAMAAAGALMLATGCEEAKQGDAVEHARASIAKKDYPTAIVQLKSALEGQPESGEIRVLLGDVLLRQGDARGALVELTKAREARFSDDQVLPLLANAMLTTSQPKKVIEQFSDTQLSTPKFTAALKAVVASAHALLGDYAQCDATVVEVLRLDPMNAPARLLQAKLVAGKGNFDEALTLVKGVLASDAQMAPAWLLQAQLLTVGKNDAAAGAQSYRQALAIDPAYVPAHTGLIEQLLGQNNVPAFKAQVEALSKAAPQSLEALFYTTELAVVENDLKRAREGAQRLLVQAPGFPPALQLAGIVSMRLGELSQAQTHLSQALQLAPTVPQSRRLLAEAQLRSGQPAKAILTLQPLLQVASPAAADLAAAAQAHLQDGDLGKAEALYAQAAKIDPQDSAPKVALALAQLAKGNEVGGLADLQALAAVDQTAFSDLALVTALMQRRDAALTLQAIDRLEAKMPGKAMPHLMRARVLMSRQDTAGARASLDKALAADPVNFTALAELSALDIAAGRINEAMKRYEGVVSRDPQNVLAALAVVDLKRRAGSNSAELEGLLQDLVKRFPTDAPPRLALVQHFLDQRTPKAAVSAAQDAASAMPNDVRILDALGRAQLAAGDSRQAINSLQKAAAQSSLPEPHLRLAEVLSGMGEHVAADASLQRAVQMAPRHLAVQQSQVNLALARGKVAEALRVARLIQQQRPTEAVGSLMEAEVHARQQAWPAAASAYKLALDRQPSTETVKQLYSAQVAAGRQPDADKTAAAWLQERPKDIEFLFHVGAMAAQRKDFAAAEHQFQQVLALAPGNALALNNAAAVILQQGKPGALPLAEKANQLAPNQAAFLDTLASALAAEKQWARAVESQQKAVALAPAAPAFRLNLARHLLDSGDTGRARVELESLAALGRNFPAQADVAAMLKRL